MTIDEVGNKTDVDVLLASLVMSTSTFNFMENEDFVTLFSLKKTCVIKLSPISRPVRVEL